MIIAYGLKNCDTCRKARAWAEAEGLDVTWRDVKTDPVPAELIAALAQDPATATALVNRRGTTWRALDAADRARADDPRELAGLIAANASLMKRPLWIAETGHYVGCADPARIKALAR